LLSSKLKMHCLNLFCSNTISSMGMYPHALLHSSSNVLEGLHAKESTNGLGFRLITSACRASNGYKFLNWDVSSLKQSMNELRDSSYFCKIPTKHIKLFSIISHVENCDMNISSICFHNLMDILRRCDNHR